MFFKKTNETQEDSVEPNKNGAAGPATTANAAPSATEQATAAAPVALDAEQAKLRAAASKRMSAAFGDIVLLMSRAPGEQHYSLRDLDWLVMPAVGYGQFALAEAQSKENGAVLPVGAILWALVSPDVDARLSAQDTGPIRLSPAEWRSGDIAWIIHTVGDPKILSGLMEQLTKTAFKDRAPKMRVRGSDGKAKVGHIEVRETVAAAN